MSTADPLHQSQGECVVCAEDDVNLLSHNPDRRQCYIRCICNQEMELAWRVIRECTKCGGTCGAPAIHHTDSCGPAVSVSTVTSVVGVCSTAPHAAFHWDVPAHSINTACTSVRGVLLQRRQVEPRTDSVESRYSTMDSHVSLLQHCEPGAPANALSHLSSMEKYLVT